MVVVVDASAIVEVIAGQSPDPDLVMRLGTAELHGPHLIDVEVLHALRVMTTRRAISASRADTAMDDFASLAITRYPHAPLRRRMWDLRDNVSAYDAAYIALAEGLDIPLVTVDQRLTRIPAIRTTIEQYPRP